MKNLTNNQLMSAYTIKKRSMLMRLFSVMLITFSIFGGGNTMADDTDIFSIEKPPAPSNVLMVFDSSGSMNWALSGDHKPSGSEKSRLQTLRSALGKALDAIATDPKIKDINIGIMNFSGHSGSWLAHGPAYPVVSLKAKASAVLNLNPLFTHPGVAPTKSYLPLPAASDDGRDFMKKVAGTWKAKGKTPLVDALYEAALYMKGKPVQWGKKPPNNKRAAHPSTYTGLIGIDGTQTTKKVCKYKPCGGDTGIACNATMRNCHTITEAYHNCYLSSKAACLASHPSYTSCKPKSWDDCKKTCPDGKYDEAGKCLNPKTVCTTKHYFRCVEPVNYSQCEHEVCKDKTITDTTVTGNAVYNSPIQEACQSSHIVLLSDGAPTINKSSHDIASFIGPTFAAGCDAGSDKARCGKELAKYLANTDHRPDLNGEHRINVHTIGLALTAGTPEANKAIQNLKDLAAYGDGSFNLANTPEQLAKVLAGLSSLGIDKARSFSSPAYTPDPNSILTHGDEVYLPMFKAASGAVWSGNLKKFKLKNGKLVDANGVDATDATGAIVAGAKDLWSKASDPNSKPVIDGGVAKLLEPAQRKLFADNGKLDSSYALIKAKLGDPAMSNARRDQLLDFIRGIMPDGSTRYHMGDILHSKPVVVSYGAHNVIFVGTNEGFLHAFDGSSGKEIFAFMPDELLKNIELQYDSVVNGGASKHLYGVDGQISLWHDDTNHNNQVDAGEQVVLYFGLRRGGKNYYALDVTTLSSPSLLWKKANNAHTWSKPLVAKLKYKPNNKPKPVVIYGGGYSEDAAGNAIMNKGNGVYVVDAMTGATVWSATVNAPVAADVRVLDADQNGSVDRLYFADIGGNIWRVDLNAGNLDGSGQFDDLSKAKLTKFASLGANHKFFVEPDVAIFEYRGRYVLTVAIGSGERPRPLDTGNTDNFFVLFDQNVYQLPTASTGTIDITQLGLPPVNVNDVTGASPVYRGWKMKLARAGLKGEKVLSSALTFQNMVMFTSFGIGDTTVTPKECGASTVNVSSLYVLDLLTGSATLDLDGDGAVNHPKDKAITVSYGEIAGTPQVIYGSDCTSGDCKRTYQVRVGKAVVGFADQNTLSSQPKNKRLPKVYWLDNEVK